MFNVSPATRGLVVCLGALGFLVDPLGLASVLSQSRHVPVSGPPHSVPRVWWAPLASRWWASA